MWTTVTNDPFGEGFADKARSDLRNLQRELKTLYAKTAELSEKSESTAEKFEENQTVCEDLKVRYENIALNLIENLKSAENSDEDIEDVEAILAQVLILCSKFAGLNLRSIITSDLPNLEGLETINPELPIKRESKLLTNASIDNSVKSSDASSNYDSNETVVKPKDARSNVFVGTSEKVVELKAWY